MTPTPAPDRPLPTPASPGPWHLDVDTGDGAWLYSASGCAIGYLEHLADAAFVVAITQQHFAGGARPSQEETA
jgi:hypothetical protein